MSTDPLISAAWLKHRLDAPEVRIIDATWVPPFLTDRASGKQLYDRQHLPGARYFDIDAIADQDAGLSHMLPSTEQFAAQVGALGIGNDSLVVVYDANDFYASARVWWMFRAMGHDHVRVLDGGLNAWRAAGGQVTADKPNVETASFAAQPRDHLVRNQSQMQAHVANGDAAILDARAQGRFDGTLPEPRKGLPSGHMPGSVCVPASGLQAQDGTMKQADALQDLLGEYRDGPVITSCGSGVSAAVIALALARIGNPAAAVYDGSWSEWAAHSDNPIATAT